MSNDKSLEVNVVISRKRLSYTIFDLKNDRKQKNENPENWQCAYAAFALHLFYMTQLSTGLDFNLRHYGISLEVYEIYEFDSFFFVF